MKKILKVLGFGVLVLSVLKGYDSLKSYLEGSAGDTDYLSSLDAGDGIAFD